ncbi:glycosyltransferase family 2 protein [Tamlana sp. s12]|uniref:glycosyltransferase family 2 protein n=1 Tax=Tamlana sp. s12 TaxID=1630406 RepID=UPI000801F5BD|nr:glycosyltransferase family 2 protein [Tamlana sp. s12]OBQ56926.1 glycosyl transferase family 2 [Tamlana sp. s12]QQY82900.1 glycosyltransferase family 2 protein [Tamlana sp. s12]
MIIVVLPAYNAHQTLEKTYNEIPFDVVDDVILVDDCSSDDTIELAKRLGINHIYRHDINKGYGGNQKTCYNLALKLGATIVIMLHPDYQYTPKLIPAMVSMIQTGIYDVVFGSRMLGKQALKGGMPTYKFILNKILTLGQNIIINQNLSEYHTGYRAYSRKALCGINYNYNSDDFLFDNQVVCQILYSNYNLAEISCPTNFFREASSIGFAKGVRYAYGVIVTSFLYRLNKMKLINSAIFNR